MKNLSKSCEIFKSNRLIHRYSAISVFILMAMLSICCNGKSNKISSQIDKSKGQWIQKTDNLYQYLISNREKGIILNEYQNKNENWRTTKETVALFYINDIDPQFSAIGKNMVKISHSDNSIIITGNGKSYKIDIESYKSIYFPLSIERVKI